MQKDGAFLNSELFFQHLHFLHCLCLPLPGSLLINGSMQKDFMDALHILYGVVLFYVPKVNDPDTLYYVIFGAMICYMPTISLSNSISYTILKRENYDVIKVFPPIRVFGTIGFIAAMWTTNLSGSKDNCKPIYNCCCCCYCTWEFILSHYLNVLHQDRSQKMQGSLNNWD